MTAEGASEVCNLCGYEGTPPHHCYRPTVARSQPRPPRRGATVASHLLADVVPCGPGDRAIQWHCQCGAWGKPVPVDLFAVGAASRRALTGHDRHVRRTAQNAERSAP